MTADEAREFIIDGINYAAYRETDSSLHDSDKNRLFGSEHYKSDRPITQPSPWAEGDFEEKMATLLRWANALNRSVPAFQDAQPFLKARTRSLGTSSAAPESELKSSARTVEKIPGEP